MNDHVTVDHHRVTPEACERLSRSRSFAVRLAVAGYVDTPAEILDRMASNTSSDRILGEIARNRSTAPETLVKMCRTVRHCVVARDLARHSKTPPEGLELLAHRNLHAISVANNPRTPEAAIRYLMADIMDATPWWHLSEQGIMGTLAAHPNAPEALARIVTARINRDAEALWEAVEARGEHGALAAELLAAL